MRNVEALHGTQPKQQTHLGLECEKGETGKHADGDKESLKNLRKHKHVNQTFQRNDTVVTHDPALIIARHSADQHRLEQGKQTQQNQVRRVLVSLPVHAQQTREAPGHRNVDHPRVCLVELDRLREGEARRDDRGEEKLYEEDRVDLADERETDLGVAVDHGDTDLEVVREVVGCRLVHPRVAAGPRLRGEEGFGGGSIGGRGAVAFRGDRVVGILWWGGHGDEGCLRGEVQEMGVCVILWVARWSSSEGIKGSSSACVRRFLYRRNG